MAGLTPLPQTVIHSSTRLTHGQAHSLLSSFLELSQTNPAYRPDAILTQHGPQSANTGEGSNLTLNHLDRILKGIAGHRVGGIEWNSGDGQRRTKRRKLDADEDQGFRSSPPLYSSQLKHEEKEIMDVEGADGQDEAAIVGIEADDWQDKEDFEHAQADVTADHEGRDPAGEGIERHGENIEVGVVGGLTPAEKEARKLAKKQRRKEEKREKKTNDEAQETGKKKKKSKS